ncbi:DUF1622 domain-containing protein [Clostridium hydrogeniformans]|uniref:DUF1622 domain-containing protein n=1 Tax=Clostridium hydrogeniformans TaxID=349933 RepID=UPI000481F694|nr:DUF1622 domain-containing protein [Clostridium hydrogeniformans]
MLENLINTVVPVIIHILEAMGIFIIFVGAIKAFYKYIRGFFHEEEISIKVDFAKALTVALEFKLAGEILKTVIVRTLDEMYILAAIIILRAVLAFVIHWEIKSEETVHKSSE